MYEELIDAVDGEVLSVGEQGFEEALRLWNGMIDKGPAVVVRPRGAADVMAAVRYAARQGLQVAARGGGHNVAGRAIPEKGMLVDLCHLRSVRVDDRQQTARVAGGALLGDLDRETQALGLATTAGVHSRTGVAGLTLGGGIGWLARRFGLASDNLIGADVVTADGTLVRASERENADLFWALRGGGAGFGVVTEFEFQLHEVGPEVMVTQAYHSLDALAYVMRHHRDLLADAPDEFTCYLLVIHTPPTDPFPAERWGEPVVALVACDTGPLVEARARSEAITDFGNPFVAAAEPMPYVGLQQAFDAGSPDGARYYFKSHMLSVVSDDFIEAIVEHIGSLPGELSMMAIEPLGGAASTLDADATAWPHRDAAANLGIFAGWTEAEDDARVQEWARTLHEAVTPHSTGGRYLNYLDRDDTDASTAAFGRHAARLTEIRRRWDPHGLFLAPGHPSPVATATARDGERS